MPTTDQLLNEFYETLTDDIHKRMLAAYQKSRTYESLLSACTAYIEEKVHEVESNDSKGNPGLQPETDA